MKYRAREIITVDTFGYNFSVVFFSQLLAALRAIVDIDLNFNQTPVIISWICIMNTCEKTILT